MPSFHLSLSTSHEDMSLKVVIPWLRLRSLLAWQKQVPTVILLPTRVEAFYWKEKLITAGHPLLGISFWTPSDARTFLLKATTKTGTPEIISKVDLELLARTSAEVLMSHADQPTASVRFLQAVQINPGGFLAHFDMLNGAGWAPESTGSLIERQLAGQLLNELARLNLQTQAQSHAALRTGMVQYASENATPLVADLLIAGFNGNYWPIWDLLAAISLAAEQTSVALTAPQTFAAQPDQMWITSWEKWCGINYDIASSEDEELTQAPFASLAASFEKGETHQSAKQAPSLIVAPDLLTHARAIVTQVLLWLRQPDCTRIGLIFPGTGPLSLAVAEQLQHLQIPHNDGTGYLVPSPLFAQPTWLTWLDLQENPSASHFLAWYLACQNESYRERVQSPNVAKTHDPDSLELSLKLGEPFQPDSITPDKEPTAHEAASALTYVVDKLLVDSLPVLQKQLEKSSDRRQLRLAEILRDRVQLPPQATFPEFLRYTYEAVQSGQFLDNVLPDWIKRLYSDASQPPGSDEPLLSRSTFLTWLRATTDKRAQKREGAEYYGKVHLLIASQMPGQSWSHLLLCEMNRGVWPKEPEPTPLLSSQALTRLNQTARSLNRQNPLTTADSNFDPGQPERETIGHGYCLAPSDRPEISLRDLCHALENTSSALGLTAALKQGDRLLSPNELFSHCYQAAKGTPLDDSTFQKLAAETGQLWGSRRRAVWEIEPVPQKSPAKEKPETTAREMGPEPSYTAFAFRTRRDASQPFGPFQFCYHFEPEVPVQMSCGDWDQALRNPPGAWFEHILGSQSSPKLELSWQKTSGIWLHSWIRGVIQNLETSASGDELLGILFGNLDRETHLTQSSLEQMCQETGAVLPHWWAQILRQSKAQTEQILTTLSAKLPFWTAFSEARLTDNILVAPRTGLSPSLILSGRMDCLLIERSSPDEISSNNDVSRHPKLPPLERKNVWVIDFKTGSPFKLSTKVLGEPQRKGWQPVLYGLALRQLGASRVYASLLNPVETEAVLDLDDVLSEPDLFLQMDRMHRSGQFGQPPSSTGEYGFAPPLPIATLAIPKAILEAKWELTSVSGETLDPDKIE